MLDRKCHNTTESKFPPPTPTKEESAMKGETSRRQVPKYDGVYVKGSIQGVNLLFTADTGATRTLISERVYNSIPAEIRPKLAGKTCLSVASGQPLAEKGKAIFHLQLGDLEIEREIIVADIEDEGLLGIDILQNGTGGPADILLSKGVIKLLGVTIPCVQVGRSGATRKVRAADHFIIPGDSECVIDVFVDRIEGDEMKPELHLLVEPSTHMTSKHQLMMSACLVDLKNTATQKVRIMNPLRTQVSIKQDTVVGFAETVDPDIVTIATMEAPEEVDNFQAIRNIKYVNKIPDTLNKSGFPHDQQCRSVFTKLEEEVPTHVKQLYEEASKGRNMSERGKIAQLLTKYQNSFSRHDTDLGSTDIMEHAIDTGDANPVKQRPRRVPLAFADEEKDTIQQMLDQGIIRESTSPWASPIVLVRKKNGKVRACVDFRRVNSLTRVDAFPLPRVQDCLDAVAEATLFSTLDLTSGFHQVKVREEDIPKTAFVTKFGLFEYTHLPMGLAGAPATFQRTMEIALKGLQWLTCLIYLDDTVVFARDFDEHLQRVEEVLGRIEKAGLKLKPEKCHLFQEKVNFLGHVVSKDGVQPNADNVTRIVEWPTPTNVTQVRGFVGLSGYYRRFIRNFSKIARPLLDLTKKGKDFKWTEDCQEAFESLKKILTGSEIMGSPRDAEGFILDTDASDVGIGAVLSQIQDGRERVIAYGSRALNRSEKNYCVTDKELLAVRYFVEYYRQYLLGRKFLVRSDHQALVFLFNLKEPKSRIARWLEILSAYSFTIEYRQGTKNANADSMSRCLTPWDCKCSEMDSLESLRCGPCKKCQRKSEYMCYSNSRNRQSPVKAEGCHSASQSPMKAEGSQSILHSTVKAESSVCTSQPTVKTASHHSNTRSKLGRKRDKKDTTGPNVRAVKTRGQLQTTEKDVVDAWEPLPGSTTKSLQRLQKTDDDLGIIYKWLQEKKRPDLDTVSVHSPAVRHYWLLWQSLEFHNGLIFKRFHKRDGSNEYLQLLVPRAMRRDVMYQMHDTVLSGHLGNKKTREKTKQRFYWYGMREDINLWIKRCDTCSSIKPPTKTPKAPMGQMTTGATLDRLATDILGPLPLTPRGNRYILVVTDHFTKWVEIFPVPDQSAVTCARFILHEVIGRFGCPHTLHSDQGRNFESQLFSELCDMLEIRKTRTSSFNPRCNGITERFNRNFLMLGREVRLPAELILGQQSRTSETPTQPSSYGEYAEFLRERMHLAHHLARKHLASAAARQKKNYDQGITLHSYRPGSAVWYLAEGTKPGQCPKLQTTYRGPGVVLQKLSDLNYRIQVQSEGKQRVVHHNKLKPYEGDNIPGWFKQALKRFNSREKKM